MTSLCYRIIYNYSGSLADQTIAATEWTQRIQQSEHQHIHITAMGVTVLASYWHSCPSVFPIFWAVLWGWMACSSHYQSSDEKYECATHTPATAV